MRRSFLVFFLSAALLCGTVGLVPSKEAFALPPQPIPLNDAASDLIAAVNALRLSNGLPPYNIHPILMQTAQNQANYMASIGVVTHEGPGGISLTERLLNAGYPLAGDLSLGGFRAENITAGVNMTPAAAVAQWTGDAPHLNTMLSPNLQDIGAGVARMDDKIYYVIDCARPTSNGLPQPYTPAPGSGTAAASAAEYMIPVVTSTADTQGRVYHEVQYGQTLWSIAIAYGTKIDLIRRLNNLPSTEIYPGQKLLILQLATPTAVPPTTTPLPPTPTSFAPSTSTLLPVPTDTVTSVPPALEPLAQPYNGFIVVLITSLAFFAGGLVTWLTGRARRQ
ncbi:MAG: CAP domain-containing protein [Anaerolineae bacterium]